MKYVFCLDERNGMAFNKKRQSRDSKLIDNLLELVGSEKICISSYSSALFEKRDNVVVLDNPSSDSYVFFENTKPCNLDGADEVIIYNWNRHYPSDLFFDFDLSQFEMTEEVTFSGSSHDEITRKVYRRK